MTDYPYEPPERMFSDTMLAFRDFELASTWGVRVESDPLGPVNKIVRLMRGQRCLKSVLWPVPAGADVRLVRSLPGWRVEVDGTTVLSIADAEIPTPVTLRRPIPWRTRAQWRLRKWFYAAVDRVVVPLGYHHGDDCGDYR